MLFNRLTIRIIFLLTLGVSLGAFMLPVSAEPTPTINYQGKLTDNTGVAVANGTYNMRFYLYNATGGATTTAIWTEVLTGGDQVQVTNGLFSVMLGSTTPLTSVDFNQPLYLGVEIGGTGVPVWDGEMSPRKELGTVPAAFESYKLGGVASSSFLRSDQADSMDAFLTLTSGASTSDIIISGTATTTNLVLNNQLFSSLTGDGLTLSGGALTANINEAQLNITGSPTNGYVLQASSTAVGGFIWQATSSLGLTEDLSDNFISDLSDVNTSGALTGNLLSFDGSTWVDVATSSLMIDLLNTTGTLGVTRGGTGLTSVVAGDLLYANGANSLTALSVGSNGNILQVSGGVPSWTSTSSLGLGDGTFLGLSDTPSSYTASAIPYVSGSALAFDSTFVYDGTNLGIGTAAPSAMLDIFGSSNGLRLSYDGSNYSELSVDSSGILSINSTGGNGSILSLGSGLIENLALLFDGSGSDWYAGLDDTDSIFKFGLGDEVGTSTLFQISSATSTFNTALLASTTSVNPALTILQSGTGDILNLLDGATEVFTVLDGGNVGIGSSSPTAKLTVDGGINATGQILGQYFTSTDATATSSLAGNFNVAGHCVIGSTRLRRRRKKNDNDEGYEDEENEMENENEEIEIKNIKEGDLVASLDSRTGDIVYSKVKGLYLLGEKEIYVLTTTSGKVVKTTAEHPYLVKQSGSNSFEEGEWTKVAHLTTGLMIAVVSRNGQVAEWETIESITTEADSPVYDIEIDDTHNFVANGIIAHNTLINGGLGVGVYNPMAGSLDVLNDMNIGATKEYQIGGQGVLTLAANGALIGGDLTGNARGASALDIQSGRTLATQVASFASSTAIGFGNTASGNYSSAFGIFNTASGTYSSAFGLSNTASGTDSSAFGLSNTASETNSSAFGFGNTASETDSSAFGYFNTASASYSSAFGYFNTASASYSSAFGSNITNNIANSVMIGPSDTAKLTILSTGNMGVGTTSPMAKLSLQKLAFSGAGVVGLDQYLQTTNSVDAAVEYGNRFYLDAANTATTTLVGSMLRIRDNTTYGNTIRGLEVQAERGTNTQGENTALSGFARTFGVRGTTVGDAGGTYEPAGVYGETQGTTQGNALRGYSSSITTASLLKLFQDTSTFTGTGLLMNFGNAGGSFASTTASKFIDLQNAGSSMFTVGSYGMLTIGDGTTNHVAGLQIGYGGICVDNDGSCTATTTGRITAVSYNTGNSDLAETYFSDESLKSGEIVYLKGGLSIGKANSENKEKIIGVVTTKPGLLLGFDDTSLEEDEKGYGVALAGRVPVRLSNENGEIKAGDELMLSSISGVAMKATSTGKVIGIALEDFDDTRAYSDTYINQFGDDLVNPIVTPINRVDDPRIDDGCYYGAGNATGEEECVPLIATTTDGQIAEAQALAEAEAQTEALEALAEVRSERITLDNGNSVQVGQLVMFVELKDKYLDAKGMEMMTALLATPENAVTVDEITETVWGRLVDLADNFIDGVLSVLTLRADRVEVKNELCVDGVCVNADDLRQLLDDSGSSGSSWPDESSDNQSTVDYPVTDIVEEPVSEPDVVEEIIDMAEVQPPSSLPDEEVVVEPEPPESPEPLPEEPEPPELEPLPPE